MHKTELRDGGIARGGDGGGNQKEKVRQRENEKSTRSGR